MQLDSLLRFARDHYIPVMLDDTRQLLDETVRQCQPHQILEIGTAIGYSGIIMLTAVPFSRLNTIEFNDEFVAMAKDNFATYNLSDRVNIFNGDAKDIVPNLTGQYDLIFMDGPKGQYEVFLPYLINLLRINGVLMCDNVLYHGLVANQPLTGHKHVTIARNMAGFLDKLTNDCRLSTKMYNIGDGVTVSTKILL